jgi:hypothetical protein
MNFIDRDLHRWLTVFLLTFVFAVAFLEIHGCRIVDAEDPDKWTVATDSNEPTFVENMKVTGGGEWTVEAPPVATALRENQILRGDGTWGTPEESRFGPPPTKEFVEGFEKGVRYGILAVETHPSENWIPKLIEYAKIEYVRFEKGGWKEEVGEKGDQ